ncbi:MAG TPA: hypothetical protein VFQ44_13175 [Streptosporangiaceae bacterium]|nr:hypothetical protein [Streptosporangiaceae bacterium]
MRPPASAPARRAGNGNVAPSLLLAPARRERQRRAFAAAGGGVLTATSRRCCRQGGKNAPSLLSARPGNGNAVPLLPSAGAAVPGARLPGEQVRCRCG